MEENAQKLHNFVFRGLLLDSTLKTLGESGLEVRGDVLKSANTNQDNSQEISIEDFPIDLRNNALKMSSAYTTLFCFENSVRRLVADRLKETKGSGWWNEFSSVNIKKRVEDRIKKDSKNKWHAPRAQENIAYCDFGDLCDLIINNWECFEDLFPTQDWVKTRLNDLEPSRNTIAHHNILQDRDVKRIGMVLRDWILQVG